MFCAKPVTMLARAHVWSLPPLQVVSVVLPDCRAHVRAAGHTPKDLLMLATRTPHTAEPLLPLQHQKPAGPGAPAAASAAAVALDASRPGAQPPARAQASSMPGCVVLTAIRLAPPSGPLLALYLSHPQPLPDTLLEAVKDHVEAFLQVRGAAARERVVCPSRRAAGW
jgi:hypothetical protein